VTIVFELSGGHTLELLKIVKQTSAHERFVKAAAKASAHAPNPLRSRTLTLPPSPSNRPLLFFLPLSRSYVQILKRITAQKGLAGVLDGFFPWGFLQAVAKGSVFSWGQALSAKSMHSVEGLSKDTKTVISGGAGGLVQGVVMSPLLLLKTRVMTDPAFRATGGVLATAAASARVGGRIIANEGPLALFKGVGVFSIKRAADWTTRYLFVVMVEEAMRASPGAKLTDTQQALASLAGGSLSALSTIPLDVLVATFQQAGSAGKKVSVMQTFRDQIAAGGVGGSIKFATRGLAARVAHVSLTTLMMKTITSWVYDVLYPAK
jgi:hypothetical protein